jgi:hypothetical protein
MNLFFDQGFPEGEVPLHQIAEQHNDRRDDDLGYGGIETEHFNE